LRTSKRPSFDGVLFLDRTHQTKIIRKILGALQCPIQYHRTLFSPDAPDDEWIPICAEQNWVIVSGDKGIIRDGINRKAVEISKAKVFLLADTDSSGAEWAASIALGARKIFRLARANDGPFYCKVEIGGDTHVGSVEYLSGGGPISVVSAPETMLQASGDLKKSKAKSPRSDKPAHPSIDFPL
jgi:hypothetical protein